MAYCAVLEKEKSAAAEFRESAEHEMIEISLTRLNDADLLDRYGAGEERAFRELVRRYKNGLYSFLRHFLGRRDMIDDVFQETFMQLFISRDSFDTTRPLRPWLFTIAANKAKDALRRWQRTSAIPIGTIADVEYASFDEVLDTMTFDSTAPSEKLERGESHSHVARVIDRMPDHLREILVLAYFNRVPYKQMAQILHIPIGTVKSRLHAAVRRFGRDYKESDGED